MPTGDSFFVYYKIDQMSRYLAIAKRSIQREFKKLKTVYKDEILEDVEQQYGESEDVTDAYIDQYTDKVMEIGSEFPKFAFGGFIITWYSFVEQNLAQICEEISPGVFGSRRKDKLGKGVKRAKKILHKFANLKIDQNHWKELLQVNRLRNIIVHKGYWLPWNYRFPGSPLPPPGKYTKYDTEDGIPIYLEIEPVLYNYLQDHQMIIYRESYFEIIPTPEYCAHLIDFGRDLFWGIFKNISSAKQSLPNNAK